LARPPEIAARRAPLPLAGKRLGRRRAGRTGMRRRSVERLAIACWIWVIRGIINFWPALVRHRAVADGGDGLRAVHDAFLGWPRIAQPSKPKDFVEVAGE
jgi:hypothetical protein